MKIDLYVPPADDDQATDDDLHGFWLGTAGWMAVVENGTGSVEAMRSVVASCFAFDLCRDQGVAAAVAAILGVADDIKAGVFEHRLKNGDDRP